MSVNLVKWSFNTQEPGCPSEHNDTLVKRWGRPHAQKVSNSIFTRASFLSAISAPPFPAWQHPGRAHTIESHCLGSSFSTLTYDVKDKWCALFMKNNCLELVLVPPQQQEWFSKTSMHWNHLKGLWKHRLHRNVHGSTGHNSRKVETTQMTVSSRTDKQTVLYAHNGILFDHKKEWSTDTRYNVDGLENIMLSEINQTQKASYYLCFHLYK